MPRSRSEPRRSGARHPPWQLLALAGLGVGVAGGVALTGPTLLGPLVGWGVTAGGYLAWRWPVIWRSDATATARAVDQVDPGRLLADVVLLGAAVASLLAVAALLGAPQVGHDPAGVLHIGVSVGTVVLSWAVIHEVFTGRYARLYYGGSQVGGIDFHTDEPPRFSDFAYLAFTVGMTFQVSDPQLTSSAMRRSVLGHAMLSFLFGAVILAVLINLIGSLVR
ncbi:DUF1345 domain-containing protein [Solwaraspora sp. WMMD791]|uniref:DUF1345 domain-containing protein n=1 Tax=Solwaraspora sp. WMMD791 TaxID=3016086 RepID=UPI00249BC135|nr:DUF1345 domain-containing protein [Solwaraspora sp. WMMD791]WFE28635.1 DUF1345 domain-containing protein [Solwaraspora sp. WMMD791]